MSSAPLAECKIGSYISNPLVPCSLGLQAKPPFPRRRAKSLFAKSKAAAGAPMRLVLVCSITGAAHARVMEHTRTRRIGAPAAAFDFANNDFALRLGNGGFACKPNEQGTSGLLIYEPILHSARGAELI